MDPQFDQSNGHPSGTTITNRPLESSSAKQNHALDGEQQDEMTKVYLRHQQQNSTTGDSPGGNQQLEANQTHSGPKLGAQTIISSVERPPKNNQVRIGSSIPLGVKQNSNSEDQDTNATNPVIISQLQQLQSPLPQPNTRDSPITPVKSRHRGFLSQLLCCFRPATSNIYQDPLCVYNNADLPQRVSSLPQCPTTIPVKYSGKFLLPARKPGDNRICLVIDLDETLVHSSFKPVQNADFIVPVEIDGTLHKVYVLKRPHVDEFLKRMGQLYECVLFTASLAKYADPVADLLDKDNIFKARLFRESCAFYRGNYVKDLSRLGRDLNRVIIVDNSPASYIFHPDNAVSIATSRWLPYKLKHDFLTPYNSFPNLNLTSYL